MRQLIFLAYTPCDFFITACYRFMLIPEKHNLPPYLFVLFRTIVWHCSIFVNHKISSFNIYIELPQNKSCRFAIYQPLKRQLSSKPYIYLGFFFPFLTLILRIILRIRNTTSTMITIKSRQIPAIIAENLLGCFTRSMIFLLSSTTLRPCVVS